MIMRSSLGSWKEGIRMVIIISRKDHGRIVDKLIHDKK